GLAHARASRPHLTTVRCFGKTCAGKRTVAPGGHVKLAGRRLKPGMRVIFKANTASRRRTVKSQFIGSRHLLARVPANALTGRLYARTKQGVRTNSIGPIRIKKKRKPPPTPGYGDGPPPTGTAFDGDAMWIWYVSKAEGGNLDAIVARARAHGIETLFVKSGDGTGYWSQFTPALVATLHAAGLRVCGWQYVYGKSPGAEAAVAARAKDAGADCFVIDAEREYEGRYTEARTYMSELRAAVGAAYPIGMSSFPYVDYHPGLPYSEFFSPGGAQFDVPQVYWKEIGDSVDAATDHTYRYNRPYGTPIAPVGQSYNAPPAEQIARFRQLGRAQDSAGLSWWEWSSTANAGWDAIGAPLDAFSGTPPTHDFAMVAKGAKGDLVVWAQRHLQAAGANIDADGEFGPATQAAVKDFQGAKGLDPTGQVDTVTWRALLAYSPRPLAKPGLAKAAASAVPKTADLPAKRYEIPGK
ncbi:MAG: hypothetical protein QOG63_1854, partial [Thermoleophilaceae bacterium]|nr:hypothetical protein [Thermoleophilaceae bacterium]